MHEILYSVIKNKMKQCKVKDPSVCFLQYVTGKVFFSFFFFFHFSPLLTWAESKGHGTKERIVWIVICKQRPGTCDFFDYSSEYIVKDHDYQWSVFIELCRYLDTSKSFTWVEPQYLNRPKQSVMLRGFCSHYVQSYQSAECWQSKDLILV